MSCMLLEEKECGTWLAEKRTTTKCFERTPEEQNPFGLNNIGSVSFFPSYSSSVDVALVLRKLSENTNWIVISEAMRFFRPSPTRVEHAEEKRWQFISSIWKKPAGENSLSRLQRK